MKMRQTSAQDKNLVGKAVHSQNRILEGQECPVSVGVCKPTISLQGFCRKNLSNEQTDEKDDFTAYETPNLCPKNLRDY